MKILGLVPFLDDYTCVSAHVKVLSLIPANSIIGTGNTIMYTTENNAFIMRIIL